MSIFSLMWEVPCGLLSFCLYKLMRLPLVLLVSLERRLNSKKVCCWRPLSGDLLRRRWVVPIIMATGPRWNPHALLASGGPFDTRGGISLDVAALKRSSPLWTLVVNTFPDFGVATSIGSVDLANTSSAHDDSHRRSLAVAPGRYILSLRFYGGRGKVTLPAVEVDGREKIADLDVTLDNNAYLESQKLCFKPGYLLQHYYIWVLLKWRHFLPERWVWHEFLPQPNPDTRFFFDIFKKGDALEIQIDPALTSAYSVYLTCYSRASFPVHWEAVPAGGLRTGAMPCVGYYLVRAVLRERTRPGEEVPVIISVLSPGAE